MTKPLLQVIASIVGALVGAIVGYAGFFWVASHGFYALALPGIFLGLGCGALSFAKSRWRGAACGAAGLCFCIFTEWRRVVPDGKTTFVQFAMQFPHEDTITLILLAVGTVGAFWFGSDGMMGAWWPGRGKPARPHQTTNP